MTPEEEAKKKEEIKRFIKGEAVFLVSCDVLKEMIEGRNENNSGEVLSKLKLIKDGGGKLLAITPMASLLRAIWLADSNANIHNLQKVLSVIDILFSSAVFKNEEEVITEMIKIAKAFSEKAEKKFSEKAEKK